MSKFDHVYSDLVKDILDNGAKEYNKRTGTYCYTGAPVTLEYFDEDEAPLPTIKPAYPILGIAEVLGYIRRLDNAQDFADIGSSCWFGNSNETPSWLKNPNRKGVNHLGRVYGGAVSEKEIRDVFKKLEAGLDDRGLVLDFWRPELFDAGCLRPCLMFHQWTKVGDKLYLTSVQRSCDVGLGLLANSPQIYWLLKLGCKLSGLKFGGARHVINNPHIYSNHEEGLREMLERQPYLTKPTIEIPDWVNSYEDILKAGVHGCEYVKVGNYAKEEKHMPISLGMVV